MHLLSFQYFPDRFVRKDILGLSISCKFHHMGCDWEGKFGELKEHVKVCDYNSTQCEFCQKNLHCDELELHKTECPLIAKACPLCVLGCDADKPMDLTDLNEHLNLNKYKHLRLMAKKISDFEKIILIPSTKPSGQRREQPDGNEDSDYELVEKDCATTHPRPVSTTRSHTVSKSPKIDVHLENPFLSPEAESAHLMDRSFKKILDETVLTMKSDLKATMLKEIRARDEEIVSLKSTITKLEKSVRSKHAELEDRDFRLSLIENSNHDGSMVWKIPQFSQRMNDAESGKYTSIFSLPFYTSRYGYKMCLRLYILGDGIGKGNYMSLFFVVMKGEFDSILQWPFTHRVTFKLINQGSGRDVVDTFQPDPMSSSFRKPKSDMNIASGCPRFISHTDLKNGGFIVDNTVFIKCTVDTSTIRHP